MSRYVQEAEQPTVLKAQNIAPLHYSQAPVQVAAVVELQMGIGREVMCEYHDTFNVLAK